MLKKDTVSAILHFSLSVIRPPLITLFIMLLSIFKIVSRLVHQTKEIKLCSTQREVSIWSILKITVSKIQNKNIIS